MDINEFRAVVVEALNQKFTQGGDNRSLRVCPIGNSIHVFVEDIEFELIIQRPCYDLLRDKVDPDTSDFQDL